MEKSSELDRTQDTMFVGHEVECTRFKGERTLFVPGKKPLIDILAAIEAVGGGSGERITHVYLGANQRPSFDFPVATELLVRGYHVTVDVPYSGYSLSVNAVENIENASYAESFALIVSVPLPGITKGVFVKIDDFLESKSNEGVWVFSVDKSVQNFTPWSAYSNDREV